MLPMGTPDDTSAVILTDKRRGEIRLAHQGSRQSVRSSHAPASLTQNFLSHRNHRENAMNHRKRERSECARVVPTRNTRMKIPKGAAR